MKHPFYSVSIDGIPFGDRIIAILLRTYLVRCKDAEQKLAAKCLFEMPILSPSSSCDKPLSSLKSLIRIPIKSNFASI